MKFILVLCLLSGCASVHEAQELQIGDTKETVMDKLGSPNSRAINGNREVLVYNLENGSKTWQWILSAPTFLLNHLARSWYSVTLDSNQVSDIRQLPNLGPTAGQAIGSIFKGVGEGLQNNSNNNNINCTSSRVGDQTYTNCY